MKFGVFTLNMISKIRILINNEEKKRFLKNFSSLATLQGLNYILPLITLPYLVMTLGADKFGLLAFATAITGYFIVLTDYGFNFTATRDIKSYRDQPYKINEIFSSVIIIKICFLVVSFFLLTFLIIFFENFGKDPLLFYLTFGIVIGQALFPVWFFQGMEQMSYITIINIISKLIFTFSIFLFVKSSEDYLYVPLLTSLGSIVAGVYSLYLVRKKFKIKFSIPKKEIILSYLQGGTHLFFTSALGSLLVSSGTVVLSFFSNNATVGYYSALERLFRAVVGLFTPITQALYPISCNKVNQEYSSSKYIRKLSVYIGGIALTIGTLVAIFSNQIVDIVYGELFDNYSYILAIMMVWLFFGVMNNMIGIQYLTAKRKDKFYTSSFVVAGLTTVVLNVILVPHFLINGILFSMIFGEVLLTFIMLGLIFRFKL